MIVSWLIKKMSLGSADDGTKIGLHSQWMLDGWVSQISKCKHQWENPDDGLRKAKHVSAKYELARSVCFWRLMIDLSASYDNKISGMKCTFRQNIIDKRIIDHAKNHINSTKSVWNWFGLAISVWNWFRPNQFKLSQSVRGVWKPPFLDDFWPFFIHFFILEINILRKKIGPSLLFLATGTTDTQVCQLKNNRPGERWYAPTCVTPGDTARPL